MSSSRLKPSDFSTKTWERLRADVTARLDGLLKEICNTKMTHEATQATRGRIAECHRLLALERAPATAPRQGNDPRGDEPSHDGDDD